MGVLMPPLTFRSGHETIGPGPTFWQQGSSNQWLQLLLISAIIRPAPSRMRYPATGSTVAISCSTYPCMPSSWQQDRERVLS